MLIDFGFSQYRERDRALLERRCALVSGWYDADNRAHVDPAELRAAIERAPHLRDYGFVNTVLGGDLNSRIAPLISANGWTHS